MSLSRSLVALGRIKTLADLPRLTARLIHRSANLTSYHLVGALLACGLIVAGVAGFSNAEAAGAGKNNSNLIRLAQAKPSLKVASEIAARPGETVKVPVQTESNTAIASTSHVIIDGAPAWLKLSKGEAVGDGVWLLRASEISGLEMILPSTANGSHNMNVLLVDKDGKIISEAQMALNVQSETASASAGKTWQSLLKSGSAGGAAAAVPAPRKVVKKVKPAAAPVEATKPKKKMNAKQLRDYAKYLVRECTTCHSLFGDDNGIPVMIGLKVDRFLDTMQLYRDGKRDNLAMINVARSLDDQQLTALANYLGSVRPPDKIARARRSAAQGGSILGSGGSSGSISIPRAANPLRGPAALALAKRKITPEKLKRADRWVAKGQALLKVGRVAQARLWFKRAAEYGVAQASMLLGSSFDPNFLISRSAVGMLPDAGKARDWYSYARQLGSQVAGQRLANLPAG